MIVKKTPKADLERKRFAFFQIGLILAGSLCLVAFEFVTPTFSEIGQQVRSQDTVFTLPEIPKEFVAVNQPKEKKVQPIVNEIEVVIDLLSNSNEQKSTIIDENINVDLNELLNLFGNEKGNGTIVVPDVTLPISDIPPKFKGNLGKWIGENIKLPTTFHPVSGTIFVSFVVSKKGEITNVKIAQSLDPEYDKAALEVVKKMPNWTPGEYFGKPVAVNYQLPIKVLNR